jgi:linoleoyl-CoA desaturase
MQKGHVKFITQDKNEFFGTLKERVESYFVENKLSRNYNSSMVTKTIVLLTTYFTPFFLIIFLQPPFWVALILWTIIGISMAGVGMSVMHDANHGAYTDNKKVNTLIGLSLNFMGGCSHNWKLQHNIMHHTYTNITGMDNDIDDKLGMRFSPHTRLRFFQRIQFLYAFILYGIVTLYWVTLKDFIQLIRYSRNGVNPNQKSENFILLLQIIFNKVAYFFVALFFPIYFLHIPAWQMVTGFLLMHFVAGVILSVIFQMAHTVEGTSHPMPNEEGSIENSWAIHQMNTTVNFSRESKWISWYLGGLNFQVEHHLFPKICHVHYPAIAHIVKETADEYGVPYLENKRFSQAFRSHIVTLKRFGKVPPLGEIIAG